MTWARIRPSAWKGRYWARWREAVREAGYDPNTLNQRIPDQDILSKLAGLVSTLGYFPIGDEINVHATSNPGFPVWTTIAKRYGGMPQTVQALLEFSRETGRPDVAKLCQERLEKQAEKIAQLSRRPAKSTATFGFVYLKYSPSLRLYKIGKADDPDKRGAGISLLLPEDLVAKHEIKTDCPFVLETYWKNRFRAKKKQGEWYDLAPEDIDTFKSRREFIFSEFFP